MDSKTYSKLQYRVDCNHPELVQLSDRNRVGFSGDVLRAVQVIREEVERVCIKKEGTGFVAIVSIKKDCEGQVCQEEIADAIQRVMEGCINSMLHEDTEKMIGSDTELIL